VFLENTFSETVQDKGMGKHKRKTAKASIYGRKKCKKRRGAEPVLAVDLRFQNLSELMNAL